MNDSEQRFLERAAAVEARREDTKLPPIGAQLVGVGDSREAKCACGVRFTQTMIARAEDDSAREIWMPKACTACLDRRDKAAGLSTRDARRTIAAAALTVPTIYAEATLESFEFHGPELERAKQDRAVRHARRYLALWPEVPDVVVLNGGYGTGKGHVVWAMSRWLAAEQAVNVVVVKLPDLIRDLREAWKTEGGLTEAARLARYRSAGLLVVDEVSRHAFYGEPRQHLYDIVDHRIEWRRPTMLTTNESGADLSEILGPALTSRIAGSAGIWDFGTHDYRVWVRRGRREDAAA